MRGYLLGDFTVEIDKQCAEVGGCWQSTLRNGISTLGGSDAVQFFYDLTLKYERPVIIDIGANTGAFSLLSAMNPNIQSYAFEPTPFIYELLCNNIKMNGLENKIKVYQIALADKNGKVILKYPKSGTESGLACIGNPTRFKEWTEYKVDCRRFDDFAAENGIGRADIIKIDTEGCELFVLKGAQEYILQYKPDILCECVEYNTVQFGYDPREVMQLFRSWGYSYEKIGGEYFYFYLPKKVQVANTNTVSLGHNIGNNVKENRNLSPQKVFEADRPLKVALLKQELDVFGPWSSVRWDQTTPLGLFDVWPNKASNWEMTCALKADWYIVPQKCIMQYTHDAILNHPEREDVIRKYTRNVIKPSDIPFDEYDIVIAFDPVIDVAPDSCTLFAYYLSEHWESSYSQSIAKPVGNYDIFLAHMMDASSILAKLPQAISFPLLRCPSTMRQVFNAPKQEKAWADWRTLIQIADVGDAWTDEAHRAAKTLESMINMPVGYKSFSPVKYNFTNPPSWGDAAEFLRAMSECKYYISTLVAGAGQGICDAASLGCICIGKSDIPCHKIICHPMCLCESKDDISAKMKQITQSPELHKEILDWQDKMLNKHFVDQPIGLLKQAVEMKRGNTIKQGKKSVSIPASAGAVDKKHGFTIFAMPKTFAGHTGIIQRNAIKSWTLLEPRPEIILFGSDSGVAECAAEFGLRHLPDVKKNEFGTPLVNDLFARAQNAASNDVLMYINSDMILMDDFMTALGNVRQRFDEFLMVGQRWNTPITSEIDFGDTKWRERLREFVYQNGFLFSTCGLDYFAFTKGIYPLMPDFGIGRSAWDNWLVWKPIDEGKVVVDATDMVMAVHQDHEYIPTPSKVSEEAKNKNISEDGQTFGFTTSASWKCTPAGVIMRNTGEFLQNNYMMTTQAFTYIEKALIHDPQTVEKDCRHAIACMPPALLKIYADGAKDLLAKQPHHRGADLVNKCISEKICSIGKVVLQRGTEYLQNSHPEESLKWLDVLVGLDVPNLNYARAFALCQFGKLGSARQACLDELQLQPDHKEVKALLAQIDIESKIQANELCKRGLAKMQAGNFADALTDFESGIQRTFFAGPTPNINYAKAVALSRLGKFNAAKQACLEELKYQPDHDGAKGLLEMLNTAIEQHAAANGKNENMEHNVYSENVCK